MILHIFQLPTLYSVFACKPKIDSGITIYKRNPNNGNLYGNKYFVALNPVFVCEFNLRLHKFGVFRAFFGCFGRSSARKNIEYFVIVLHYDGSNAVKQLQVVHYLIFISQFQKFLVFKANNYFFQICFLFSDVLFFAEWKRKNSIVWKDAQFFQYHAKFFIAFS